MRYFLLTCLFAGPAFASDRPDQTWHLLQKQADGDIAAIIHGLTKDECEFAKNRIEGNPATPDEVKAEEARQAAAEAESEKWAAAHGCRGSSGSTSGASYKAADGTCYFGSYGLGMRSYGPHDVMSAECFQ